MKSSLFKYSFPVHEILMILFIFLFINIVTAQEDSIIAENTYKHQILNGNRTIKKMVIEQKTFDLQRQLIRQVFFDSIPKAKEYAFYFYLEGHLFSKETYNHADSIQNIRRFIYNSEGMPVEEKVYYATDEGLVHRYTIKNFYNDTILVKRVVLSRKNKKLMQSTTVVDCEQRVTGIKYKKQYNSFIKNESITTSYSGERISERKITRTDRNGSVQKLKASFEYDMDSGLLMKEIWRESSDDITKIIIYGYDVEGNIKSKSIMDKHERYLEYYSYEYKKYLITLGNQNMYDLK